jgi:hypothetical protein
LRSSARELAGCPSEIVVVEPYFVCNECGPVGERGTIAYCGDHEAAIRLIQEGKVDLKPFVTGRIPT